jgi:hypothetical protein
MSQAKVDAYKKEKKNRKKIMRREKIKTRLSVFCVMALLAAAICWFSWAVYNNVKANANGGTAAQTELDLSAIDDYKAELSKTAAEGDASNHEVAASSENVTSASGK